jgi:hypothetical protein
VIVGRRVCVCVCARACACVCVCVCARVRAMCVECASEELGARRNEAREGGRVLCVVQHRNRPSAQRCLVEVGDTGRDQPRLGSPAGPRPDWASRQQLVAVRAGAPRPSSPAPRAPACTHDSLTFARPSPPPSPTPTRPCRRHAAPLPCPLPPAPHQTHANTHTHTHTHTHIHTHTHKQTNKQTPRASPAPRPTCTAAPSATTSSGLTLTLGSLPVMPLTMSWTAGMRVEPPTRMTSWISAVEG